MRSRAALVTSAALTSLLFTRPANSVAGLNSRSDMRWRPAYSVPGAARGGRIPRVSRFLLRDGNKKRLTPSGRAGAAAVGGRYAPAAGRARLEERFLALLDRYGVEEPETGAWVAGYELDFLWPRAGLVVELDGLAAHKTRAASMPTDCGTASCGG